MRRAQRRAGIQVNLLMTRLHSILAVFSMQLRQQIEILASRATLDELAGRRSGMGGRRGNGVPGNVRRQ
jgi:hypothetical protein